MAKAIEVEEPYPYPDIPFPQVVWGSQALANPAIQEQTRIGDPHSEATLRSQESSLRELASPVQEERPERHSPADRSS